MLGAQVADKRFAIGDQFFGGQVIHAEIVRSVAQAVPVEAQPAHVVLDGAHVFGVFARRVGVVQAQVADAAKLGGHAEIQADRLGMADMQVTVGFRRKAGLDGGMFARGKVIAHDLADEVGTDRGVGAGGRVGHGVIAIQMQSRILAELRAYADGPLHSDVVALPCAPCTTPKM